MQDLKHLSNKKKFALLKVLRGRKKAGHNSFKTLKESPSKRARLLIILPALALFLGLFPCFIILLKSAPSILSRFGKSKVSNGEGRSEPLDSYGAFRLASGLLSESRSANGKLVASLGDGGTIYFTIDPWLQARVNKVMAEKSIPYGVFVAIEPKSGRVLALSGYSAIDPSWGVMSSFKLYPMASLFKIITASAALEEKKVEPDTMFAFRGYSYSENPRQWNIVNGKSGQQMPLSLAMGKSVNPVFGRLASDVVGKESIMTYVHKFGFNETLFPGTAVVPSRATEPQDDLELKLMGAGLGREVKISPLHAAVIMAALANQGTMMAPILAQEIRDKSNKVLIKDNPSGIRRLVRSETAEQLAKMLMTTVTSGTSRKAFHDRSGRPKLTSINVAAKTGSINGKEPEGYYSWFAAYAPVEDPKIALVALVINRDHWKIKASYLGEQALEEFFADSALRRQQALVNGRYSVQ
jgi:penicillin-binding protein A